MLELNSVTLKPNISKHLHLIGKGLSGGRNAAITGNGKIISL